MSIITPQYTIENDAPVLVVRNPCLGVDNTPEFATAHGTVENNIIYPTVGHWTVDLSYHQPAKAATPTNVRCLPLDQNKQHTDEGAVFFMSDAQHYLVYNPNAKLFPYGVETVRDPRHLSGHFIGVVDLDLATAPRKIQTQEEFDKFLPNFEAWERALCADIEPCTHKQRTLLNALSTRPEYNELWFKREFARTFAPSTFGKYRKQPAFILENFFNLYGLFPYMSSESPGQLAYQPPETNYRDNDRQITTKPGRFLNKFFDLTSDEVRGAVSEMNTEQTCTFKLATTPAEFEHVYLNGPSSCMSHHIGWYDSSCSTGRLPISVLANGNIKVAYLELENGVIPARSLVVEGRKDYVEIYHNNDAMNNALYEMQARLEADGYDKNQSALVGERIEKLETDCGQIVCPYLDVGGLMVDEYSDSLCITEEGQGDYQPNYSTGVLEPARTEYCNHCGNYVEEDGTRRVYSGDSVCEGCIDDEFHYAYAHDNSDTMDWVMVDDTVLCETDGEYYRNNMQVLEYHGVRYLESHDEYHHEDYCVMCDHSDELIHVNDSVHLEIDEVDVSSEYIIYSNHHSSYLLEETAIEIEGEYYHADCADIVMDEAGIWHLLDTTQPITLEKATAA